MLLGLPPNFHDFAGEFMAHHTARMHHPPTHIRILVLGHMQIGAANTAGADFQNQIRQTRFRIRNILDRQGAADFLDYRRFHLVALSMMVSPVE